MKHYRIGGPTNNVTAPYCEQADRAPWLDCGLTLFGTGQLAPDAKIMLQKISEPAGTALKFRRMPSPEHGSVVRTLGMKCAQFLQSNSQSATRNNSKGEHRGVFLVFQRPRIPRSLDPVSAIFKVVS